MQALTNNAQIDYQYVTSGETVNLSTKTNYVTTNISKANINILKTSNSSYFAPGDRIGYNIFIANSSNVPVFNVIVTDHLPKYLFFVENSATVTNKNGAYLHIENKDIVLGKTSINIDAEDSNTISFKLGNIAPSETVMISYFVIMPSKKEDLPETISTYATLYYSSKNEESNNKITVNSNINLINKAYALLVAEKLVDKSTVFCGDKLTYTILLNNKGNIDATNVRVTDILPDNFKLEEINFTIADLPYTATYKIDKNNILNIPAESDETGLCIPANTSDNSITMKGIICE